MTGGWRSDRRRLAWCLAALVGVSWRGLAVTAAAADKAPEPYAMIAGAVWMTHDQPATGVKVKIYCLDANKKNRATKSAGVDHELPRRVYAAAAGRRRGLPHFDYAAHGAGC